MHESRHHIDRLPANVQRSSGSVREGGAECPGQHALRVLAGTHSRRSVPGGEGAAEAAGVGYVAMALVLGR
jgi:hypothetical protein